MALHVIRAVVRAIQASFALFAQWVAVQQAGNVYVQLLHIGVYFRVGGMYGGITYYFSCTTCVGGGCVNPKENQYQD